MCLVIEASNRRMYGFVNSQLAAVAVWAELCSNVGVSPGATHAIRCSTKVMRMSWNRGIRVFGYPFTYSSDIWEETSKTMMHWPYNFWSVFDPLSSTYLFKQLDDYVHRNLVLKREMWQFSLTDVKCILILWKLRNGYSYIILSGIFQTALKYRKPFEMPFRSST